MRVLRIKAAVENFNDNMLQKEDITYLREIVDYANETNEPMVTDELSKYDCINKILEAEIIE